MACQLNDRFRVRGAFCSWVALERIPLFVLVSLMTSFMGLSLMS